MHITTYGWEDLALNSFLEMNCGSQKLVGQTTEGAWSWMLSELMPSLSLAWKETQFLAVVYLQA